MNRDHRISQEELPDILDKMFFFFTLLKLMLDLKCGRPQ